MIITSEENNFERIVSPTSDRQMEQFENTLRPKTLSEYVGQEQLKHNLLVSIEASKKRSEPMDHLLFHGPPGLGKTTLAYVIANELEANISVTSGPALEKQGDLAAILSNLNNGDVLFIDEIHRLKPVVEEVLYTAMEDFAIDIVIGKGPSARTVRIDLPKFTLIGATTKMSMISSPLRDRFGNVMRLNFYEESEICEIIMRSAKILGCNVDKDIALKLAYTCRKTPRIANRLLKRVRDFADVKNDSIIDQKLLKITLNALGIDELGLDGIDREILQAIIEKFNGGPVGLNTISAAINEEEATIEDIYEPFLIQLGFLDRTARGRIATKRAFEHLGFEFKA